MESERNHFQKLTIPALKDFLRARGQSLIGKKAQLVARAEGCVELNLTPNLGAETDASQSLARKFNRLGTPTGYQLPNPTTLSEWQELVDCPAVTDKDVYNYLVLSHHRTTDNQRMGAQRQLKAKTMFDEGHVHSAYFHRVKDAVDHGFVKASVMPSLPGKDPKKSPDYQTWICLSKHTGHIHSADCTCTAGDGESCNHIAAVLYMLVDMTEKRERGLLSSTSQRCAWLIPRKRILSPKKVADRPLRRPKSDVQPSPKVVLNLTRLSSRLQASNPHCSLVSFTSNKEQAKRDFEVELPPVKLNFADHVDLKNEKCLVQFEDYVKSLKMSESEIKEIEACTRGQAKCVAWHNARSGRVTSSQFGAVMCRKADTEPDNLVKSIMGYCRPFQTAATKWGKNHEAAARRQYFNRMATSHPHLSVADCGLVVDHDLPFLATSPDGLVHCPDCVPPLGLVEVKCPYTWSTRSIQEACADKSFCCALKGEEVKLKTSHPYFYQVQGQMGITGRKWCDFVVWTVSDIHIERISIDEDLWKTMQHKLRSFFVSGVVPEMFSSRILRNRKLHPK